MLSPGVPQCWIQLRKDWHWQLYMVVVAITVFIIPCILISACYIIIVYTIWSKSKEMMCAHRPLTASVIVTAATPQICQSSFSLEYYLIYYSKKYWYHNTHMIFIHNGSIERIKQFLYYKTFGEAYKIFVTIAS